MSRVAALPADIAFAVETRAFLKADERQVRNFDETGAAAELSDLDLHKDFMRAADNAFLPAPRAPVPGMDMC
jgi:hypothetical protein